MRPLRHREIPDERSAPASVLAVLSLLILSSAVADATADDLVVVVIHGPGDTALARRIGAELETLGLGARLEESAGDRPPARLDRLALEEGVHAAIRADAASGRVEVWVEDRSTDRAIYRSIVVPGACESGGDEIALGAVELLRASSMEVRSAPPGETEPPAPEPETEEPAIPAPEPEEAQTQRLLSLEVGPAVTGIGFDTPPTVNIALGIHIRVLEMLGVEAVGVTPLVSAEIEEDEGVAEVHFGLVGGGLRLGFGGESCPLCFCGALGFAAAFFEMSAHAEDPLSGREELVATSTPYARVGLAFEGHERVRVRAELMAGWTLSRTVVRMAGREVVALGTPLLAGALVLELVVF